ncbi:MAG: acyl-CoA mutase large subunit family protein, partial [Calditrichia bacterium]|nr:acyl-CoA mutase large subunit family protein [Calditrichia bacterium]
ELKGIYRLEDMDKVKHRNAMPGFFPYVRGTNVGGYLTNAWEIAQEIFGSTPKEFNEAITSDLKRGQTTVSLTLDSVSGRGQDSDHGDKGEVGKGGVAISTLEDLETAFKGINLEETPINIDSQTAAVFTGAFLVALMKKQGYNTIKLSGNIEFDPIGQLAKNGELPYDLEGLYNEMAYLLEWANKNAPGLKTISVDATPYHNAGASAVQELAYALATGVEYVKAMLDKNFTIDEIASKIRFSFALGSNFFMEISKLRAAKMLWARIVEEFGGNENSQKIYVHCRTSGWNKTVYDPYVNMLRTTTEAFSGVMGGCDSMHVASFDEAIRKPDEFSRRIARNVQIILKEECHFDSLIDPVGGSWYIEKLTQEVAETAWKLFQEVEQKGGALKALQDGFIQQEIEKVAEKRKANLATRKDKIVGTNIYPNLTEKPVEKRPLNLDKIFEKRSKYLNDFRTSGDLEKHIKPLEKLGEVLEAGPEDIFEKMVDAAYSSATIGEIKSTIRFNEKEPEKVTPIKIHRGAEMFEELRDAMKAYIEKNKTAPKVFLANMGPVKQYKARADFSAGFFQVGGFEIVNNPGFETPEAAAEAAIESKAPVVVICSSDPTYPELVPPLVKKVKDASSETTVILAGYPKDQIEDHKRSGVDEFIHIRANVYEILVKIQKNLGVLA